MRGIGRVPKGPLRQTIRENVNSYALDEPDPNSSSYSGLEYQDKGVEADIWLYSPQNFTEIVLSGEQYDGSLQGLCLPNQPVEEEDRLTYGDTRYEVDHITPYPSKTNVTIYELSLSRVQEDTL